MGIKTDVAILVNTSTTIALEDKKKTSKLKKVCAGIAGLPNTTKQALTIID